jgi:hypothetical protein
MIFNFLFGYSKSGKSTFLGRQKYVIDTSGFMYIMAERLNRADILDARTVKDSSLDPNKALAARLQIVDYIERELILGIFGSRREFVQAAFRHYMDLIPMDYDGPVWISTVNLEEFQHLLDCVPFQSDVSFYNIRRVGELPGVDIRELHDSPTGTIHAYDGNFYLATASDPSLGRKMS